MRLLLRLTIPLLALGFLIHDAYAGVGPWAQSAGKARLTFGYSRKTAGSRWTNGTLTTPADSQLVDGHFHDFRYAYLSFEVGVIDNLELSGTINYLWGYEAVTSDPITKKPLPKAFFEYNNGFTDSWLNLKYQVLKGEYPVAVEVSTRFPDLYNDPSPVYTRYKTQAYSYATAEKTPDGRDTIVKHSVSTQTPTSEWRGLLKRDLGIFAAVGHSFDGKAYVQSSLGYNFRQGAFADQVIFSIDGGYTIPVMKEWTVMPKVAFDYTGGLGNGGIPDSTDRFGQSSSGIPQKNSNFNNGRYGRLYGSLILGPADGRYALDLGIGKWIFGNGAVQYTETYAQFSYQF
ncbi:MAG: hypothetical protein JST22_18995 [Bacteroidetes bacterium]|nr:hypothetical protein [Bacteroidota bacterium]